MKLGGSAIIYFLSSADIRLYSKGRKFTWPSRPEVGITPLPRKL
jgi:hypothetical protein